MGLERRTQGEGPIDLPGRERLLALATYRTLLQKKSVSRDTELNGKPVDRAVGRGARQGTLAATIAERR